ncbi:MAG TPA: (2Fe-2S)-binding protein [Croceibacterium sp.]|nr:(2Fe-2S)-binding protein [Croceibacterium sp.]
MASAPLLDRATPPTLAELRGSAAALTGMLRLEIDPEDREGWISGDDLCNPEAGPSADLHARFIAGGFACNRRASAASLLLRYGWAAGWQIAAWLERGVILHADRFAVKFSQSTLMEAVWVQEARIEQPESEAQGYRLLLDSLRAFTGPLVESQHQWSRFSRHALWSMAVSSWAAQFAVIGERLGRRDTAMEEARRIFALDPVIERAAPESYVVSAGSLSRVCQKRAACCLYYKGPAKHFCVSCPIIPREERLARNREFT